MFHLEHDPSLFEEIDKGTESVQNVDYAKVKFLYSCFIYYLKTTGTYVLLCMCYNTYNV